MVYTKTKGVKSKKSKYKNKKCEFKGIKFDSLGERERFMFLIAKQNEGKITNLQVQVPFDIIVNNMKICKYVADFTYQINNSFIVEDFKGVETAIFKLKKKLMLACNEIDVVTIKSPTAPIN